MGWIPRRVEDDDPVGGHQVDAKAASLRRDQEESHPMVSGLVEVAAPLLPLLRRRGAVHAEVVAAVLPRADVLEEGLVAAGLLVGLLTVPA